MTNSSLLGAILTLSLVSVLSLAAIEHTKQIALSLKKVEQRAEKRRAIIRLETILQQAFTDLDTHRLPLLPRLHTKNSMQFTDGSSLSFSTRTARDGISDAISFLLVEPIHALLRSGSCFIGMRKPLADQASIGVTQEGLVALRITTAIASANNCYTISLTPAPSLLLPTPQPSLSEDQIFALIPIHQEVTLYRDSQSQLRYLSTEHGRVIENQPIAQNLPAIHLRVEDDTVRGGRFLLKLFADEISYTTELSFALARVSPLTTLTYGP